MIIPFECFCWQPFLWFFSDLFIFLYIFMFSVWLKDWKGRSVSGSNLIWSLYSGPPAFQLSQAQPSGSRLSIALDILVSVDFSVWDVVKWLWNGCEVGSEGSTNVWRESYWLLELGISTTDKDARSETMEAKCHSFCRLSLGCTKHDSMTYENAPSFWLWFQCVESPSSIIL